MNDLVQLGRIHELKTSNSKLQHPGSFKL
jgi:hypothetical protein